MSRAYLHNVITIHMVAGTFLLFEVAIPHFPYTLIFKKSSVHRIFSTLSITSGKYLV